MKARLPHLVNRRDWTYTCWSKHYVWSTLVTASSKREARVAGLREARRVMGNHAPIHKDQVEPA